MSIFSLIEVSDSLKSYYTTCALDSDVHAAKKAEQGYPTCLKMISYLSLGGGGGDCIDNAKRPASIHEASWNLRLLSGFPSYRNSTRR
ncbi:hypothetical protein NC652_020772 [Populus alba x Populus x berolinensis]|nr:hypothetical protein NC652_020772 [Populus alba x Populus x berolinensis]